MSTLAETFAGTFARTETFTRAHAAHIAAKIKTGLKRMQDFYEHPSEEWIDAYEREAVILLMANCLGTVAYGFQRNGLWVEPTLLYTARGPDGASSHGDSSGRVMPGAYVGDTRFNSYLTYNSVWHSLSQGEKERIERQLPFQRVGAPIPGASGDWVSDRTYSAGGRALYRRSLRNGA